MAARRDTAGDRWESLCHRCGLCCYARTLTGAGLLVNLTSPCRYLDEATRQCTVYGRRFQVCPRCRKVTLLHALFYPYLPPSCGYVRAFRIWRKFSRPRLPE